MQSKKDHVFLLSSLASFFVLVTLFFVVNAQVGTDIDKDGVVDGYDAYLSDQINARKIPPTLFGGIRTFVFDAQGASILNSDNTQKDSYFTEYKNNAPSWSWKTKFQRKGHARGYCNPPMLNISFDKKKSDGTPRPLFDGVTTYNGLGTLRYQEIRAVSNCSSDDDSNNAGFGGYVGPHLREYFIFSLFRNFGIPTADILGFGVVKFTNTADASYNGKSFPYMFLQRNSEQDDQIPLTTQFGLKSTLIEDGKWDEFRLPASDNYPNPSFLNIFDVKQNKEVKIEFDPEAIMRYRLFSLFSNPGDRGPLHNEEYGQLLSNDKWVSIAHGFDLSLWTCDINYYARDLINYEGYLGSLSASEQATFKPLFYRIGYETFSKKENLYKMLAIVDQFPLEKMGSTGKKKLKEFIRLQFSAFNQYFSDPDTARRLDANGSSNTIDYFPFSSNQTFTQNKQLFASQCKLINPTPDIKLVVNSISDSVVTEVPYDQKTITFKVSTTLSSDKQYALIPKNDPLLATSLMKYMNPNKEEQQSYFSFSSSYTKSPELIDEVGLYYVLPTYTKTNIDFTVSFTFSASQIAPGDYVLNINGLKLHTTQNPINISGDLRSKNLKIEGKCPVIPEGVSSKISNVLAQKNSQGSEVNLTWSKGQYIPAVDVVLIGPMGVAITNPKKPVVGRPIGGPKVPVAPIKPAIKITPDMSRRTIASSLRTNTFIYKVDKNITPGTYVFEVVASDCVKAYGQSNVTTLSQLVTSGPTIALIKDATSPSLQLTYDENQKEVLLVSSYKLKIDTAKSDVRLMKTFLAGTHVMRTSGGGYYRQAVSPISGNFINEDDSYVLKADNSFVINLKIFYNPNQMFAGNYKDSIDEIYLTNLDRSVYLDTVVPQGTQTNLMTIIGERAPYITSVSPVNPIGTNQKVTIVGERFPVNAKIIFFGKNNTVTFNAVNQGNSIEFVPQDIQLPSDSYTFYLETEEGRSNYANIEIVNNVGLRFNLKGMLGNAIQAILNWFH